MIIHDVSRDGRILAERYGSQPGIFGLAPGQTRERDLSWFDGSHPVGLSDDGLALLINESGDAAGRTGAYYLRKTDGSPAVKLGQGEALGLSADGKWVLARHSDSRTNLVLQPTGTGTPIAVDESSFESVGDATLFPDGKRLLLAAAEPGKKRRLYVQELPSGKPRPITDRAFGFGNRSLSPDGRWIAAYGDWSEDMLLLPVEGGNPRTVPESKDLDLIRWTADGKAYFAVLLGSIPARVFRVDVATGRREDWKELAPPERAGIIDIGPGFLTPDGKSYVYGYSRAATSDLYVIEGLR